MTVDTTAQIIAHIINLSIGNDKIPTGWKIALITPLYKDGERNIDSNYRPSSVLPALLKIMKRIIHNQLYRHIREHNQLSEAQFRFRKDHSTATCILKLLDHIYSKKDKGNVTNSGLPEPEEGLRHSRSFYLTEETKYLQSK